MFAFEKAAPSEVSVSEESIVKLLCSLEASPVTLHSLLIMKDDKLIFEKYFAPYSEGTLHRMFSISKSFTAMGISLLIDDGLIDPDKSICDYFPEYVDENTHPFIRQTTIRNMLMMRSPHASTTYKVCMKTDWVESFFKVAPTHKPGTVFHYDTSAAHVLCALVEKLTGKDLLTFLKDRVLHYVDFSEQSYMIKDPFGVSMGGSGLMALPMDIMKFLFILYKEREMSHGDGVAGSLLSHGDGVAGSLFTDPGDGDAWPLFNPEFVREATGNLTDTYMTAPVASEAQGYGLQIWMNQKGGFTLYGMGGQLGICIPSEKLLIVTTADTQGLQGGNQMIYDAVYRYLVDGNEQDDVRNVNCAEADANGNGTGSGNGTEPGGIDKLSIMAPRLPESYALFGIDPKGPEIPGTGRNWRFSISENPSGFNELTVHLSPGSGQCYIEFTQSDQGQDEQGQGNQGQGDRRHRIAFGMNGNMIQGIFPIYETRYVAGGLWTRDNVLYIKAHLIGESVGSVHFQLYFGDDDIVVFMKKIEETFFSEFEGHLYGKLI